MSLVCGQVGVQEQIEGAIGEAVVIDKMFEDGERGHRIEEGVVPAAPGGEGLDPRGEAEPVAETPEGMLVEFGPGRAAEVQGIDPGAEGVAGKGPEEAFFGAVTVSHDHPVGKETLELGPEGKEAGSPGEIIGRDSVDASGGPGDGPVGMQERTEGFTEARAG